MATCFCDLPLINGINYYNTFSYRRSYESPQFHSFYKGQRTDPTEVNDPYRDLIELG